MSDQSGMKSSNPKDIVGSDKFPLHLWPETATVMGCLGFLDGALKYGRGNFRPMGVKASIYYDAAKRHLNAWFEGEDLDPDSGLPHLSHALACIAIIVDSQATGNLTDDRQYPGGYRALVDALTPHVARIKARHVDKSPKHYTIQDTRGEPGGKLSIKVSPDFPCGVTGCPGNEDKRAKPDDPCPDMLGGSGFCPPGT